MLPNPAFSKTGGSNVGENGALRKAITRLRLMATVPLFIGAAAPVSAMAAAMADPATPSSVSMPIADDDATVGHAAPMPPGPLELKALDYIRYRDDIAYLEGLTFDDASVTREAHKRLAAHDSWALTSGWMAYAALIAADTPAFAEAVKAEVNGDKKEKKRRRSRRKKNKSELAGRDAFIAKIAADPFYPRIMPGADEAVAAIVAMTNNDGLRITSLGESFKSQAYAMQKTRWGKRKIASGSQRIGEAEAYAQSRPGMAMPHLEKVLAHGVQTPGVTNTAEVTWTPAWGHTSARLSAASSDADRVMARILNLAARYAVDGLNDKVVLSYAKNTKSEQCLSLARLTLKQCMAATRTPYEEAFCLGEHGINDVAGCVGWVSAN